MAVAGTRSNGDPPPSARKGGGRKSLTPEERGRLHDLTLQLIERIGGWDAVSPETGIPYPTVHNWRYGGTLPEASSLLLLLRAAGVLDARFLLPAVDQATAEAAAAALRHAQQGHPGPSEHSEAQSR